MKRKKLYALLGAEAVLCLAFHSMRHSFPKLFSSVVTFPLEQIGAGLRALSLSGSVGNIAANLLYVALALIPSVYFLWLRGRGRVCRADTLLPVMSALLFPVLYYMVNPQLFWPALPSAGKMLMGCTFYSLLAGWIVLRLLHRYVSADAAALRGGLRRISYLLCAIFVFRAFGTLVGEALDSMRAVRESNTTVNAATDIFTILKYLSGAIPCFFDIAAALAGIGLIEQMGVDRYSEEAVLAADCLAKRCRGALTATVGASLCFNLLQFIFCHSLQTVNTVIEVPVFSLVLQLGALLFAEYIRGAQRLKQDNDLFI